MNLHTAIAEGNTETALALIANGADVKAIDNEGFTPLHRAAKSSYTETALALIEKGADVNATDQNGRRRPLHQAAIAGGNTEIALALIEKGANVNAKDRYDFTPLSFAIGNGYKNSHTKIAIALIERGADVNATDSNGRTLLQMAAISDHTEIAVALIEKGADVNATGQNGSTPLHCSIQFGKPVTALALIANDADVNATDKDGSTPLALAAHLALTLGRTETVRALTYQLHYAARLCDIKTVKALIDKGYLLQAKLDDKTPLEHAIAADNLNVAKCLIVLTKPNFSDLSMPEINNSTTKYIKDMHKLATTEHDTSAASALTVGGNEIQNEVATKLSSMVQSTVDMHNNKIDFAKALFGMPTTDKAKTDKAKAMVKFMMFNLTFKIKGSYRDAIVIARDLDKRGTTNKGKIRPSLCPDVIGIILNFAGLMPDKTSIDAIAHPYYKALNSSQVKSIEVAAKHSAVQNNSIITPKHGSPAATA